ncbi:BTAD domain-containing putative transcriptional regulator [Streptomyces justiciae]|uniref:BTAD domain-containing putative transcriptional regulator n=1 Tax=Streptomyces justiciae TaxID=2780140 RepID=A0ABU3M2T5_9ACTN|nr:BTAD domain-containing putative transcriptional regulator [Streptomyces justiciae]MDT7845077.1 BTAD domain-containing putative transcriptional regulator [Streptomyces justiciae]
MKRCELRFGLLGPPVLYDTDAGTGTEGPVARVVGSPKVRVLLAALLLEAGRTVSVDALKDALWGGSPPASAQASLHNHVTRLRRLLDDPERLRAVPPGYLLRVEQGELDVHVFESLTAEARAAHAGRDWERTVRASIAALTLWRGTPLAGLPPELGGYAFVQRLGEARLLLLEWRYDAELAVGGARLDAVVPELTALAAEHPLREAFHRQLMLALHRTGRQAEALAVHRDLRTRLIEELGVEPGAGVREAHVEVLRGESGAAGTAEGSVDTADGSVDMVGTAPALFATSVAPSAVPTAPPPAVVAATAATTTPAAAAVEADPAAAPPSAPSSTPPPTPPPRPAQLPPPPPHFTGRATHLDDLRQTLTPHESPHTSPSADHHTPVAVISGTAGVGKSALALHTAHALRDRFPDGQLYVNLHGATPGMTPLTSAQALTALLRDLGADPRSIPEHPDAAAALLRSMLAPTRTLMVLDDAENAAQVRRLLPAGPGCAVIVTSRSPLAALDGARRFPLEPLSAEESAALLRAASGRGPGPAPDAEDDDRIDATHPLVELTGRLPLALRIVGARLAARRALTPDVLADQLAATESRLQRLEYDDLSVRRSLAVAHDALAASGRRSDRDAALALRRLGALDLPTYGAPLVARLLGTDTDRAEEALDRLVDVALLEETAYGRYAPHDLVRDFARELAESGQAADVARTGVRWYTAVAERVLTETVVPGFDQEDRRRPTPTQPPEHAAHVGSVPPFAGSEEAFAWSTAELENIVALAERHADAADERTAAHVSTLLRLIFPCLQRGGRVSEMEVLGQVALQLARRLGDEVAEAYALSDLAGMHFLAGRHGESLAFMEQATTLWRRLGMVSRVRRCLGNQGLLLESLGRYAECEQALLQCLELSPQLDDPWGDAVAYGHLGNLYEHTDPRAAIEYHRRSLAIGSEIGNVIVAHSAHCNIGYAYLTLGEPAAAVPHFEESLSMLGGHSDWHGESQSRLGLVRALRLLGRTGPCESECAELLRRADARADGYTGGLARHQYGLLLRETGRAAEAQEQWRIALAALDGTDKKEVLAELRELLDS